MKVSVQLNGIKKYLLTGFVVVFIMAALSTSCTTQSQWVLDPASYVNPFIGTLGETHLRAAANTVPGAVMPFGMFNFGPETAIDQDMSRNGGRLKKITDQNLRMPLSPGGYNYAATRIKGFSLTRLSGTGCLGASGDIPILPFTENISLSPDMDDSFDSYYSIGFNHDEETAKPGYYQVKLANDVNVELSATERTGIARFSFPDSVPMQLLFRTSYSQLGSSYAYSNVDIENDEITGHVVSGNFCGYLGEYNRRDYYTLYFVAKVDKKIVESGAWENGDIMPGASEAEGGMPYGESGIPAVGNGSGVWVQLDATSGNVVNLKVGISYVSLENARANLKAEQDTDDTVESVAERCYAAWNDSLSRIKVESDNIDQLVTFFTALYHSLFHPNIFSDSNGEYTGFDGKVHTLEANQKAQYANFSGWDVYRSQLQLLALTHPERASDIAQSLLNQANQYNGIWDRWTHNSGPTGVMSGDPSTIAIANFVAFGCDKFNVDSAYDSLTRAAKVPTEFDLSPLGKPVFTRGQKPSLDQWLELGYISDDSNCWEGASETLEQASAYFALSQLAQRLDHLNDYQLFLAQSGNWKNLYNPQATEKEGYIQGRNLDGSWKEPFNPTDGGLFVEGSPKQYLWMVPFDGAGLFEKMGGMEAASARLDSFFRKPDGSWALYRSGGGYSDVSNQPSINAPWMYLFAGKAYKTQETVRAAMAQLWKPVPSGIPGQDDLGEMSSWYVFSALGMYPLYPGRAEMVLASPTFTNAMILRESGNIRIVANGASPENIYVESLKVNGKESFVSWLDESIVQKGGTVTFTMSSEPNYRFGSSDSTPPSYASEKGK